MKTTILLILTIICVLLLTTAVVYAQPGLPSAPSQAPVDGGLGLLAAAGGAYAVRKLHTKKKDQNNNQV